MSERTDAFAALAGGNWKIARTTPQLAARRRVPTPEPCVPPPRGMPALRLGLVGCGQIVEHHARALLPFIQQVRGANGRLLTQPRRTLPLPLPLHTRATHT